MCKIELFNKDCIAQLKLLPKESIDVILTSPPYNLGNNHHTGNKRHKAYDDEMPEEEYQNWQIEVLKECYRVLSPTGSLLYNHKHRIKEGILISPYEWLFKTPFKLKQMLTWINYSQNFDKCRFFPFTEEVYWLSKTKDTQFLNTKNFPNVFQWPPEGIDKAHSRSFPKKMVFDLLSCFPSAKTVLDPFMGSGTVGVVCKTLKKDFIGIEINQTFFEFAKKRIDEDMPEDPRLQKTPINPLF